jgi:hypothetical protein
MKPTRDDARGKRDTVGAVGVLWLSSLSVIAAVVEAHAGRMILQAAMILVVVVWLRVWVAYTNEDPETAQQRAGRTMVEHRRDRVGFGETTR